MLEDISVFHSSIRIPGSKIIYFDPYKIDEEYNDADLIFITHEHYDHYSKEDIKKVFKDDSTIVAPISMQNKIEFKNVYFVEPNKEYNLKDISFSTVRAYNVNKKFHPKENDWLGYIVNIEGTSYYVAGDTDINEDNSIVKCDIAFLPCGGTYTMDYKEAAKLANTIKPKIAIPTHYGVVAGSKEDGSKFVELLDAEIEGIIKIK